MSNLANGVRPINFAVCRSMTCKYERMFKRARRLYVFMHRKQLRDNPAIIVQMAERGCDRGLWAGDERAARQSILNNLFRIEYSTTFYLHGLHTSRWHRWMDESPWRLPEALPEDFYK